VEHIYCAQESILSRNQCLSAGVFFSNAADRLGNSSFPGFVASGKESLASISITIAASRGLRSTGRRPWSIPDRTLRHGARHSQSAASLGKIRVVLDFSADLAAAAKFGPWFDPAICGRIEPRPFVPSTRSGNDRGWFAPRSCSDCCWSWASSRGFRTMERTFNKYEGCISELGGGTVPPKPGAEASARVELTVSNTATPTR